MRVFVIDAHSIFRLGLVAALAAADDVERVDHADEVLAAIDDPALDQAEIVIVDGGLPHHRLLVQHVRTATGAPTIVLSAPERSEEAFATVVAGASGWLVRTSLEPQSLLAAVRAVHAGACVLAPDAVRAIAAPADETPLTEAAPARPSPPVEREAAPLPVDVATRLSERELAVLRLVAAGHSTREVARRLAYSERTIKNVLHDVSTKLGTRSRSQAVALAIRDGLI